MSKLQQSQPQPPPASGAKDLIFDLSRTMQEDNIVFVFRGSFSQNVVVDILSLSEKHFIKSGETAKVKKKIYNLMVEGLQNITRHQAQYKDHSFERNGLFVLQKKESGYFITTGNLINSSEIESLKTKLEKVNLLNKEELKEHFKNQLVMGEISNKGGAGLGLLDMARKSGNKLAFDFVEIDKNYSYFYFRLEVNSETEIELPVANFCLNYVSSIHKFVNNKDIAVIYNDIFDQDVQRNLLSYLEKRLKDTIFSKPLVVETVSQTIKTIVEQGDTADNSPNSRPAIFFINKVGNDYLVNCGSYIHNSKINILKRRLNLLFYLKKKNINIDYLDTAIQISEKLTFTSLLPKLNHLHYLYFNFQPIANDLSFFSLQIIVKNEN